MSFTVSQYGLYKGYVSVYDMVSTKEEAWTLMAIMQSISHTRPIPQNLKSQLPDDFVLIIDNNLERRIPAVDLKKGDAAVEEALKTFAGTVKAVKVADARKKLGQTLNEDGSLKGSRDDIVNKMRALLDALGLHEESGKQWKPKNGQKEINHNNYVNMRFYDYNGNPLMLVGTYLIDAVGGAPFYVYVTSGQNPDNSLPKIGPNQGDITGGNIMGIDLYVGRSASSDVANWFLTAAKYGPRVGLPFQSYSKTVYAYGAKPDMMGKTSFPQ